MLNAKCIYLFCTGFYFITALRVLLSLTINRLLSQLTITSVNPLINIDPIDRSGPNFFHAGLLKVAQLTDKLKNQSESNKQAQDNLHKQVQEQKTQLRSAQDRAQTLETSVTELTAQLTDSKEKVSQLDAQVRLSLEGGWF